MNLHEKYHEETVRLPNVLLGVASAAIAFAFHETSDRVLSHSLIPVGMAVGAWSLSFASGVFFSRHYTIGIKGNIALNLAEQSNNDTFKADAQRMFDTSNNKARLFFGAQQWLLLAGALFYAVGHGYFLFEEHTAVDAPHQSKLLEALKPNCKNLSEPAKNGNSTKSTVTVRPPPA